MNYRPKSDEPNSLPLSNGAQNPSQVNQPQRMNQSFNSSLYDVIVVGAGAAGLYAVLCLPDNLRVALVTKDTLDRSASDWAQGGIAAAIAPDDSPQLHISDTLKAGAGLCEPDAVQHLAHHAADCVRSLVDMGVAFDRKDSHLALTLEAAHSRRRVLHAADTTGRAIIATLMQQVMSRSNLDIFSDAFMLDLWMESNPARCRGIQILWNQTIFWLMADAVVLATGGGGQVFSQTTNPEVSTGDGVAMAWRAGALLRDLEFVQFHPTALTQPGAPRFLISEAVRGEGAHLINQQGRRFALDYHPAGELASRDVVSRAIFQFLEQDAPPDHPRHVWLDLRPIKPETIRHRFPNIVQVCQRWGIDVFHEPIPVAPAAHYWMGGICVDLTSQSSILGLYAVGETASTGVHGANRLASNSLLECLVFGAQLRQIPVAANQSTAAANFSDASSSSPRQGLDPDTLGSDITEPSTLQALSDLESLATDTLFAHLKQIRQSLPDQVWRSAGICRTHDELVTAIAQVRAWRSTFAKLPLTQALEQISQGETLSLKSAHAHEAVRLWGEVRNLLDIAWLILISAEFRTESRGGHYRMDHPQPQADWQVHTLVEGNTIRRSPPVPSNSMMSQVDEHQA